MVFGFYYYCVLHLPKVQYLKLAVILLTDFYILALESAVSDTENC